MVINPIVGVYIPIIRIPIKGWMTIPNIATFDHGTYMFNYHIIQAPNTGSRSKYQEASALAVIHGGMDRHGISRYLGGCVILFAIFGIIKYA